MQSPIRNPQEGEFPFYHDCDTVSLMESAAAHVRRVFLTDPERLVEGIRGSELIPCQLSRRAGVSELHQILLPQSCLDLASLGPSVLFTGLTPRECYTLIFVLSCPEKGRSFNFSTEHGDGYLGLFPPGGEIDAVTPAGYANATLTVPVPRFLAEAGRVFPDLPDSFLENGGAMRIPPSGQQGIRQLVAGLRSLEDGGADALSHAAARETLERELLDAFFSALRSGLHDRIPAPTSRVAKREQRFREVREFLETQTPAGVGLPRLCEVSGLSARGLENLFQDHLGITPVAYLRHRRLHEARRRLQGAVGADEVSVKQVALDLGFWHLGRFAGYYREFFGENPSSTLPH
jgi:AraC-like DNA-binding protein